MAGGLEPPPEEQEGGRGGRGGEGRAGPGRAPRGLVRPSRAPRQCIFAKLSGPDQESEGLGIRLGSRVKGRPPPPPPGGERAARWTRRPGDWDAGPCT